VTATGGVVVVGTGGHARSVVDAWDPDAPLQPVGCLGPEHVDVLGVPWVGSDDDLTGLAARGIHHVVVAVGDNRLRSALTERCLAAGLQLVTVIAATAQVARTATVGAGSVVLHRAVLGARAVVGRGAIINTGATVDHDITVGDFVHIAPGVHLAGGVDVGEGALVGIGSAVVPNIRVGAWAVVGAGAAVVDDVPAGVTVVGVPARQKSRSRTT